jgi:hypothetical protein
MLCVCVSPLIKFGKPQPIFMKLGMYVMAPEPIPMAYFINPSHQSVCLYAYPPIIAGQGLVKNSPIVTRQRLGKHVPAAINTHAKIEELLDTSFSMRCRLYGGK